MEKPELRLEAEETAVLSSITEKQEKNNGR